MEKHLFLLGTERSPHLARGVGKHLATFPIQGCSVPQFWEEEPCTPLAEVGDALSSQSKGWDGRGQGPHKVRQHQGGNWIALTHLGNGRASGEKAAVCCLEIKQRQEQALAEGAAEGKERKKKNRLILHISSDISSTTEQIGQAVWNKQAEMMRVRQPASFLN